MILSISKKMAKRTILLSTLGFLLMPLAVAQATCNWRAQTITTNLELGGSSITGGCYSTEKQATTGGETCTEKKPEQTNNGFTVTNYLCCCDQAKQAEETLQVEPPKFEIPEMQIDLGVAFSPPTCVSEGGNYECQINWLGEYLTAIYNYSLKIGAIIAAIVLMTGGVMWLISGGDAGKIGVAKEIISGSIIGLLLLFSSYVILTQINPDLVKFKPITLGSVGGKQMDAVSKTKDSGAAATYTKAGCATNEELETGVDFYATGYCKPAYENTDRFFCFIAMNCSCPNGRDTSKNCDKWFGNTYPGYAPCNYFSEDTPYCGQTASGAAPEIGTIAGPDCDNLPLGRNVCFTKDGKSTTYKITDRGSGIQGKRIDIWTGNCSEATKVSGVGTLKLDVCPGDTGLGGSSW